jgi:hypothetical protein
MVAGKVAQCERGLGSSSCCIPGWVWVEVRPDEGREMVIMPVETDTSHDRRERTTRLPVMRPYNEESATQSGGWKAVCYTWMMHDRWSAQFWRVSPPAVCV